MKRIISPILILASFISFAQKKGKFVFTFKETPMIGVGNASNLFFDYDNDGDLDVLVSGYNDQLRNGTKTHTFLYKNDGKGNFTQDKRSKFMGVQYGSIDAKDMDNDGDLDLVITGEDAKRGAKFGVEVYKNEKGVFKKIKTIAPLDSYNYPTHASFIKANKDDFLDLLIAKDDNVEIYFNNKRNDFVFKSRLKGISKAFPYAIKSFDMDKDGDEDILVQGEDKNYEFTTKVYENKLGRFSWVPHNLKTTYQGIVSLVDINADEKQDVFMSNVGNDIEETIGSSGLKKSVFYMNQGTTNFRETTSNIHRYNLGTSCFVDLDNDNDLDLIIMGSRSKLKNSSEAENTVDIYVNTNGTFKLYKQKAFEFLRGASIIATDIDGDKDQDILISGFKGTETPRTMLYINKLR